MRNRKLSTPPSTSDGLTALSRRGFLTVAGVGGAAVGLSACGSGGGSSTGDADLELLGPTFGDSEGQAILESDIVETFQETNPDTGYNYRFVPFDRLNETLGTAMAGGITPDVIFSGVGWVEPYAENGLFQELPEGILDGLGIHERLLEACIYQDRIHALPYQISGNIFTYNREMFEAKGIEGPPETLEELRDIARELQDDGIVPIDIFSASMGQTWITFLSAYGGQIFTDDGMNIAFNDGTGEAAVQFMIDLIEDGSADFNLQASQGQPRPWQSRQVAIDYINGTSWPALSDESPDMVTEDAMGIFLAPGDGNTEPSWLIGGTLVSMSSSVSAENEEVVHAFMRHLFDPEAAIPVSRYAGTIPALVDPPEDEELTSNRFAEFMMDNLDYAVAGEGGSAVWTEFRAEAVPELEAAMTGSQGAKETIDRMEEIARAALDGL